MKGLTLTELIVVAALFVVLIGALVVSYLTSRRSHLSAEAYIQVQQEARRALEAMVKELRESRSDRLFLSGTSTIVFQVPNDNDGDGSVVSGGTLEWGAPTIADGCVQYTLTGTELQRTLLTGPMDVQGATCGGQVDGTTARILGNDVDEVTFTSTTGGLQVSIATELTSQLPGSGQRATLSSRVQFRNL